MSFRIIKGTFHVVGYSPDGDSIRFKAFNSANWASLEGIKVKLNTKQHAQLRIEAIDTLETHYENQHQPLLFAEAAATRLFALLGITDVVWNASHSIVTSAKDGVEGLIVSRTTEENGRPVSFVFGPNPGVQDGQEIFVDAKLVRKSVNYRMINEGLAYPTFYDGLFYDLRKLLADQSQKARAKSKGLWAVDTTNKFVQINGLRDVVDNHVLLPKLFRRIVTYLKTSGGVFDAQKFVAYLKKGNEKVLVLNKLHFTHFDNLIEIDQTGKIRLSEPPEDLVFLA
jgi:endonuclease YncB( thermonuclease family)